MKSIENRTMRLELMFSFLRISFRACLELRNTNTEEWGKYRNRKGIHVYRFGVWKKGI